MSKLSIAGLPDCDCDGNGFEWDRHDGRCELKKAIIRIVFARVPCIHHDCCARTQPCEYVARLRKETDHAAS